jgi:hypothetical protein
MTSTSAHSADASDLAVAIYDELHRAAARLLRGERPGQILQATALVNEAYLRLADASGTPWQDDRHFFAIAARVMRQGPASSQEPAPIQGFFLIVVFHTHLLVHGRRKSAPQTSRPPR